MISMLIATAAKINPNQVVAIINVHVKKFLSLQILQCIKFMIHSLQKRILCTLLHSFFKHMIVTRTLY